MIPYYISGLIGILIVDDGSSVLVRIYIVAVITIPNTAAVARDEIADK